MESCGRGGCRSWGWGGGDHIYIYTRIHKYIVCVYPYTHISLSLALSIHNMSKYICVGCTCPCVVLYVYTYLVYLQTWTWRIASALKKATALMRAHTRTPVRGHVHMCQLCIYYVYTSAYAVAWLHASISIQVLVCTASRMQKTWPYQVHVHSSSFVPWYSPVHACYEGVSIPKGASQAAQLIAPRSTRRVVVLAPGAAAEKTGSYSKVEALLKQCHPKPKPSTSNPKPQHPRP